MKKSASAAAYKYQKKMRITLEEASNTIEEFESESESDNLDKEDGSSRK
ncbi:63_t:CDS:2 [Ambispora leptoticha]|uniref:63_t:CDS:1 n=1 Tax=Ambispora leptoticha TaxID=144679 RepID=A0A9N9B5F5_9GLOM|nr:63_t:CDS:2 [Ambispora leptoticha]